MRGSLAADEKLGKAGSAQPLAKRESVRGRGSRRSRAGLPACRVFPFRPFA